MASPPDIAPGFIHNLETCVGCHACVIACANENALDPSRFWRHIVTHNAARRPDLPVYHLSLSCNHCLDAPCIDGCPAVAIERQPNTCAVLIDDAKCIGCRYCSWVCPYDAPKYHAAEGVMSKCTLCHHRLVDGLQPACTTMCPTGALSFGQPTTVQGVDVHGFPTFEVRPSIAFLPMTGRQPQPAPPGVELPSETIAETSGSTIDGEIPPSKTTLGSEWPLAVFTFIGIVLEAWVIGAGLGEIRVIPELFAGIGLVGLILSTLHLGRKDRAWRAILNWRRSWLSREVILYPAFLAAATTWTIVDGVNDVYRILAAAVGAGFLFSVDRVYSVMARAWRSRWDDAAAIASALFLGSVLGGNVWGVLLFGALRVIAFVDRMKLQYRERPNGHEVIWVLGRVGFGLVAPLMLWGADDLPSILAVGSALIGELIDRLHFYASLDIVTPRRAIAATLLGKA